jgi:hypothetical protein
MAQKAVYKESMIILKKPIDNNNKFSLAEVTMEIHAEYLPDILQEIKGFLMACGYPIHFGDELCITKEGEE